MYLDIPHLDLLLLKGVSCLALAMIKCAVALLAAVLHLLTHAVIFALCLSQVGIIPVPLFLEFRRMLGVLFPQVLVSSGQVLEGLRYACDDLLTELLVLGGARFQS